MAAFRAIGDVFLVVFLGIFLALVFEYPVRFVMAKTGCRAASQRRSPCSARRSPLLVIGLLLLVPLVGSVRDFLQDLPRRSPSCRTPTSCRGSDTGAGGNVQEGAQQVSVSVPDAISAVLGIAGDFFGVFLASSRSSSSASSC